MTVTVACHGSKAEVERALAGELVRAWDGKGEVRVRPTSPIRWTKHPRGKWRGEREAEPVD